MSVHDDLNATNAAAARAAGFPDLIGTPAQIRWANTVRVNKVREFDTFAADWTDLDRAQQREVMLRVTSAALWLDGRDQPWQVMFIAGLTDDELAALTGNNNTPTRAVEQATPTS